MKENEQLEKERDEDRAAIRDADDILDAVANHTNGGSLQAVLDTCQRFATEYVRHPAGP